MKKVMMGFLFISLSFMLFGCKTSDFITNIQTENLNIAYGEDERQVMDIYYPTTLAKDETRPMILYIHGGGWLAGDKSDFAYMKDGTLDANYVYASMNYHYAGNGNDYLTLLNDIKLAVSFVKNHEQAYHINPEKMAVVGSSAGAHLALLYAYKVKDSEIPVAFVISNVGPTDFTDQHVISEQINPEVIGLIGNLMNKTYDYDTYLTHQHDLDLLDASPLYHVDANVPPSILAYGKLDNLVPYQNGEALDQKLTELNVDHQFILFQNSGHGLESELDEIERQLYFETFISYLSNYLP